MKWAVCNDSSSASSSSDDDVLPVLPDTSSDELSTIEESNLENGWSASSSSSSNYMSSFIDGSVSSLTSDEFDRKYQKMDETGEGSKKPTALKARRKNVASVKDHIVDVIDSVESVAERANEPNSYSSQSNLVQIGVSKVFIKQKVLNNFFFIIFQGKFK